MHYPFPRVALLLALLAGACDPQAPQGSTAGSESLLPNYTDRGIVILEANPQRPNYWDFADVAYGERPAHVFKLKNLDPATVTFRSVMPACGFSVVTLRSADGAQEIRGLTNAETPPFRLAPGAEATLEIVVDTTRVERMNLDKLVVVRVVCDSKITPFLAFEAHLKVLRDFVCTPGLIDLGEVPQGYGKRASGTVITEERGSKASILGLERVEGPFQASVDATEVGGERTWMVVVDAKEDIPFGLARGKVVLRTSGSDGSGTGRPFEIPVSGQVVPRIVARPAQLRLSLVADSAVVAVECLVPGEKVEIRSIKFEGAGPDFAGEAVPQDPDGRRSAKWKVTFRVTEQGAKGGYTRTAVLELDDPLIPDLRVPVTVDAR